MVDSDGRKVHKILFIFFLRYYVNDSVKFIITELQLKSTFSCKEAESTFGCKIQGADKGKQGLCSVP